MGWFSGFTKAVGLGDVFDGKDSYIGKYFNDFKDYWDGTAAMRKQNDLMRENWNMQNEYNTPLAQMQRFKEAGLNPNLIYGQTNMAGAIGTPTAPKSGAESIGRLVSTIMAFYQIGNMIAQNKNLNEQNSLIRSQADFTGAQAERYRYETKWLKDHGTTSFESPEVRSAKGVIGEYADSLGSWVGNNVGAPLSRSTPEYTLKASDFATEAELKSVFKDLSSKGYHVDVDWSDTPGVNRRAYRGAFNRRYEGNFIESRF